MHYTTVKTATLVGLEVFECDVEVDVSPKSLKHDIEIVGLGDKAIQESKKRVESAIKNSGYSLPFGKITVNLAPSDLKKEGSSFDLPICVGILGSAGVIRGNGKRFLFMGELSLAGEVKGINGVLPILAHLGDKEMKFEGVMVSKENAREAAIVKKYPVYAVETLNQVVNFLNSPESLKCEEIDVDALFSSIDQEYKVDFSDVKGQAFAKRGLEIAAAGGHNILMIGSPGCGKTMLARRFPTILPSLTLEEAIEVTEIYSIVGKLPKDSPLILKRPFRSPHHTASDVSLIGGGMKAKPGEASLAHNGVLFLDELPEFRRNVLESLRQPLEDGKVSISRSNYSVTFPSRFTLIGAMNPCPCGYYGDPIHPCTCTPQQIISYRKKISGPLLDRIDIYVEMSQVNYKTYHSRIPEESSADIRKRVQRAKKCQLERFKGEKGVYTNASMDGKDVKRYCKLTDDAEQFFKLGIEKMGLTARGMERTLKVARTIADLNGNNVIDLEDISEALQYRQKKDFFTL
ncbi:MAG: hypothetical protein DRP50_05280 [Thermotoga sp.]|nr:MAG: hypothetical protein DRP50_05280 [Thermotoga sp.]